MTSGSKSIFFGNRGYVFVIAGLASDVLAFGSENSEGILDGLIPSGCQIIPYDSLLNVFSGTIPRGVIVLTPVCRDSTPNIESLLAKLECGRSKVALNEDNFTFWAEIEEEWRRGRYFGTWEPRGHFGDRRPDRFLVRSEWVINGTDNLAPDSGGFRAAVTQMADLVSYSAKLHRKVVPLGPKREFDLSEIKELLESEQIELIKHAIADCRRGHITSAFFEPTSADTQFLSWLGLIDFAGHDSGETYYYLHPFLFDAFC